MCGRYPRGAPPPPCRVVDPRAGLVPLDHDEDRLIDPTAATPGLGSSCLAVSHDISKMRSDQPPSSSSRFGLRINTIAFPPVAKIMRTTFVSGHWSAWQAARVEVIQAGGDRTSRNDAVDSEAAELDLEP